MRRKFGKRRLEYRDPIESMDRPSNMEIGICWYQKGTNKSIYALINHLMIDLKTTIALASMIYIAYLHPGGEKVFDKFFNGC